MWLRSAQVEVISGYIGGIRNSLLRGDDGSHIATLTPIEDERQRRAIAMLSDYVFNSDVFLLPSDLARQLRLVRRDFELSKQTEDPKLHESALGQQKKVLDRIIGQDVLSRLTNSALYGGQYDVTQLLSDLTQSIFNDPSRVEAASMQWNLRHEYVRKLCSILENSETTRYSGSISAATLHALTSITNNLAKLKRIALRDRGDELLIISTIRRCTDLTANEILDR
jgi:hypothetical protein